MDGFLILEFQTQKQANDCLAFVNILAETYWANQGYTVVNHQLIGKNALTGADDFTAAKTISWDEVKTSPAGTFYFTSLTGTHFAQGMSHLDTVAMGFTEKPFPPEWVPVSEVI